MPDSGAHTDQLVKARQLLTEGMLEPALDILNHHLLAAPADTDALDLLSFVFSEANRTDTSDKIRALADAIRDTVSSGNLPFDDKSMVTTLFEAGYALTDVRQFALAGKMFEKCLEIAPDEPVIRYELAFVLMSLNRFQEAIPHFERSAAELKDFDTNLNLAVCHTLNRDLKAARQSFEKLNVLASSPEERKELAHRKVVLKRLEEVGGRQELNARDWLYTLYGSVLLRPQTNAAQHKDGASKSEECQKHEHSPQPTTGQGLNLSKITQTGQTPDDRKLIALTMLLLRGVLEGLRLEVEVIEFYNPASKPLARILAELMELQADSYKGPDRPERALLMMAWATDITGPHQAFIETGEKRTIFAYGLPPHQPLPLTPEIVALLADEFTMPWSDETRKGSVDEEITAIVDIARRLDSEPEVLKQIQDAVEYYHLKRDYLMLGNHEAFPERPEYTAEIPGHPDELP